MVTYVYTDAGKTAIKSSDGKTIPAQQGNGDYDALIASGEEILDYTPSVEEQLVKLKAFYDIKLAALDASMQNALWADGSQEATTRAALSAKRTSLIRERSAAIKALTGN